MKDKLLSIIAAQIGVDVEDIKPEDSLRDDLHMSLVDLTEITEALEQNGFGEVDLSEIDTVEELIEALNLDEVIGEGI